MRISQKHEDEYLDLVDTDDHVIGKELRSEVYGKGTTNFRVVNAFVINSKGQLFIPRRASDKRIFPECLDMSLGEHVKSGETYDDGFARGLREELNMDIHDIEYTKLGKMTPQDHGVSANMTVYEIKSDVTPPYNKKDFIEFFWLTPDQLRKKIEQGDKSKSDLLKIVDHFFQ